MAELLDGAKVTNQRQTTALTNGQFTDVMEVTFQTKDNVVGSVKIPIATYSTKTKVVAAINARVEAIDTVAAL